MIKLKWWCKIFSIFFNDYGLITGKPSYSIIYSSVYRTEEYILLYSVEYSIQHSVPNIVLWSVNCSLYTAHYIAVYCGEERGVSVPERIRRESVPKL